MQLGLLKHQDVYKRQPEENAWTSWNHTLAREERAAWILLSTIRRGVDVSKAIKRLNTSIERLTKLYRTDALTVAFNDRGFDEKGFAAVAEASPDSLEDTREHPGYDRLRQLLALVHNSLGFSYRTLGQMGKAAEHYRAALEYVRIDRDEMIDFRGKVLNNLARVLSELGWNSLGMCLDGLDPVSYTHLDVYKRQGGTCLAKGDCNLPDAHPKG